MIFNSLAFFIFLFVVLTVYYGLAHRAQNVLLLIASYFFYGWWDWRFCSLLLISTLVDFVVGLQIEKAPQRKKRLLVVSMVTNLGLLGVFKYFNFFIDTAAVALESIGLEAHLPVLRIILPVGISFYTFQTMSYTIDVYRGHLRAARNLADFALYVAFFPQLVAGPIERATHLLPQFQAPRTVTRPMVESGCHLILIGLFRKVVIADNVAPLVNAVFSGPQSATWIQLATGTLLFAVQIYCDFAGYSDIARGTSRLFGFELMVNFAQPYFSKNISEFWRRWHISLSSWLRDYLYIPLGGNRMGPWATYRNLFLTMLLGGLWHGARWNFVIWGGLHGLYLAFHKLWLGWRRRKPDVEAMSHFSASTVMSMAVTFLLVNLAWIFFRAPTLGAAWDILRGLATFRGGLVSVPYALLGQLLFYGLLLQAIDYPVYRRNHQEAILTWPWPMRGLTYAAMFFMMFLLRSQNDIPFIYFQF